MRPPAWKINSLMQKFFNRSTQYVIFFTYCVLVFLTACTPAATPAYFIPPTPPSVHATGTTTNAIIVTPTPGEADSETSPANEGEAAVPPVEIPTSEQPALPSPTPACTNILSFIEDITVTDGTVLATGEAFVKQWRVKNDGTCNWDSRYKFKLVSGDPLGSPTETTLYPAPAGAEAILELNLITPSTPGLYHTVWQAYTPDGTPFEQAIYVEIVAQ